MPKLDIDEFVNVVQDTYNIDTLVRLYTQQRKRVKIRISRAEKEGFGENYAIQNAKLTVSLTPTELLEKAQAGSVSGSRVAVRLQNAVIDVLLKGEHYLLTKRGRTRFNEKLKETLAKSYAGRFKLETPKQLAIFTSIMEKMRAEKLDLIYSSDSIAQYAYRASVSKGPGEFVKAFDKWAERWSAVGKTAEEIPEVKKTIKSESIKRWRKK